MGIFLALVLALTVKQDKASLRAGCDQDSTVIASLPAGTQLELRYMMAGESSPCYKVKATLGTRQVEGYLAGEAMEGLANFERSRRRAEAVTLSQALAAARTSPTMPEQTGPVNVGFGHGISRVLVARAEESIEANEPRKALELLEPELKKRKDPGLLAIAGVAAWKADEGRRALEFWRESLEMSPNPALQGLYSRVERELANDQSNEKLYGTNVVLRFEDGGIPKDTARQMLAAVDAAYLKISQQLGCRAEEKIVTIVQNRQSYLRATNAAEWSGGLYDGRIRIPMYDQSMGEEEERILAHETTHACLALLGHWPMWFHEGMAQRLSGATLSPFTMAKLVELKRAQKLPSLKALAGDWNRLEAAQAAVAYALAFYAVNTLYDVHGTDGVMNLIRNPERIDNVIAELDKTLATN